MPSDATAPVLRTYQSLWAMEGLPYRSDTGWSLEQRVELIAAAGFDGLAVDLGAKEAPTAAELAPPAAAASLRTAVFAFVDSDPALDTALEYAASIGAPDMVVCGQVFDPDPVRLADVVHGWHTRAAAAGVDLQLETHRNTMTNDLRATVRLLAELDPTVDLAIDLSHHVCGCELPDEPIPEIEDLIAALLARTGSVQGRVASRCQVQVPLDFPAHQRWVERFRGWWQDGFAAILQRHADGSRPATDVMFCAELGTRPYAIVGADGHELSDRWAEALTLRTWAQEAFAAAESASAATTTAPATPSTASTSEPETT
ncbi:hypothetical protein JL107_07590 [Nakamurella flavida]|uniref:Sugar phosphate isomerase/epimerase n=1 Tax=Nakamurella flavida TaxID=363630 RepID=A0A938YN69_9ACTN|nr:hypothetical protein [Nakamurella flavida]MBM9476299.1 hypothetical protein [Nakamurella flavida]MDP9779601.1 hypothetical protein [Nakamurella flavida]